MSTTPTTGGNKALGQADSTGQNRPTGLISRKYPPAKGGPSRPIRRQFSPSRRQRLGPPSGRQTQAPFLCPEGHQVRPETLAQHHLVRRSGPRDRPAGTETAIPFGRTGRPTSTGTHQRPPSVRPAGQMEPLKALFSAGKGLISRWSQVQQGGQKTGKIRHNPLYKPSPAV